MIFRSLAVAFCSALTTLGADWQQQVTPATPGNFPPPRPLRATYRCGWSAFSAADLDVNYSRKGDLVQLDAEGGTTGLVRSLWRLDATHTARARASTLLPVSMRQVEIYPDKTLRTELDFDEDGVTKFRESKPWDKTPPRRKRFDYPDLFDLNSAFLFVRSQRLNENDVLNLVVIPGSTPYLATVRVLARERVQMKAGRFPAIKLDLKLQRINKDLALEPHQKFKRATAWLSDDADRLLLKMQADIFVGSVWTELTGVRFAKRAP